LDSPVETIKLSKRGQLSLPRSILRRLNLEGEATLLVDVTPSGAIELRPAAVLPIEVYSAQRLKEFESENKMTPAEAAKLKRLLKRKRG
jgi:bifunctional DNA-binding transcriptional regulator/antitoxin component of YhaV-PrlF toxin-antitoxin module